MKIRSTTILYVKKDDKAILASDGQVTLGDMVCKGNASKVRKISKGKVAVGFAGSVADCLTLTSRLEEKLEEYSGDLTRSVIELSKDWRSDKYLKSLEAQIIAVNKDCAMILSGRGEVLEVEDSIASVGSGSKFALSAAKALIDIDGISAKQIVEKAMKIAGDLCVYTNSNLTLEEI